MSDFLTNVTTLLKEKNITKNKLLTDLHLSKNSFVDWKRRGTIPSAKVVSAIAEYLDVTLSDLMGVAEDDSLLETFSEKLTHQLTISGKSISDLSIYLSVSEDEISDWLCNNNSSYEKYYTELSRFFEVSEKYWKVPFSISPGIEPTLDEYLLILLYRDYKVSGKLNSAYGDIEYYFPGISKEKESHSKASVSKTESDKEWLNLIHSLPYEAQLEFKGELKGYLKAIDKSDRITEELRKAK